MRLHALLCGSLFALPLGAQPQVESRVLFGLTRDSIEFGIVSRSIGMVSVLTGDSARGLRCDLTPREAHGWATVITSLPALISHQDSSRVHATAEVRRPPRCSLYVEQIAESDPLLYHVTHASPDGSDPLTLLLSLEEVGVLTVALRAAADSASVLALRAYPERVLKASGGARVYHEFEVDSVVRPQPGRRYPRYPDAMRAAGTEGRVVVQFIVDTLGQVELSSFRVIATTNGRFADSVRDAARTLAYSPATVGGMKVRQLSVQVFTFELTW